MLRRSRNRVSAGDLLFAARVVRHQRRLERQRRKRIGERQTHRHRDDALSSSHAVATTSESFAPITGNALQREPFDHMTPIPSHTLSDDFAQNIIGYQQPFVPTMVTHSDPLDSHTPDRSMLIQRWRRPVGNQNLHLNSHTHHQASYLHPGSMCPPSPPSTQTSAQGATASSVLIPDSHHQMHPLSHQSHHHHTQGYSFHPKHIILTLQCEGIQIFNIKV
eukprot:TRINITY_DN12895_c0_g1_i1.p1 TRINITY_DN12895_c0_g1~~TRINITY_DN12895_c0_g1_i1.p1  ORF type:complete len:220 (+),score=36.77 TRINITY_DN12895_c0_g1_i1:164-823(+)